MAWLRKRLLPAAIVAAVTPLSPAYADIGDTPVIGGLFNSTEVLKNQITSSLSYSTRFARDMTLFTIGGLTLETYLLTLPLDANTKSRVMTQLADPTYSIPLGYFLYQFYDRYTGISSDDEFKAYLQTVYDKQALKGFEHSLFALEEKAKKEPKQHAKDQAHHEGIQINGQFMAAMVTVYDALVQIGEWQDMDRLPEQYTYLTKSPEDLELVAKIQPIVVGIMQQAASGMEESDMKQAILGIVADGAADRASEPNNKAQALTITLIDFVRLNVLKAYRQFVYQDERQERLNDWLQNAFDDHPQQAIEFLESQQNRRFAVQITVDGLQQGLIEGLVDPDKPFLSHAYQQHLKSTELGSPVVTSSPEHVQSMRFLQVLSEQTYRDPYYLPFFKRLYQNHTDSIARVGISSTPTISVRNLPIIKTGAKVSGEQGTGIPNFHFVDRNEDRAYYFFGNDALQLDRLMQANQVQTMFDRLVHLKTLNCNAQYDWNAHTSYDGLVNLGAGEALRDFGEKRCLRELNERAEVENVLTKQRQSLIDNIQSYQEIPLWDFYTKLTRKWKIEQDIATYAELDGQGMPDYALIYNPWPDHFAHFVGPFSDEIIMPTGELNRLDYWIRQIEQAYKDAGIYQQTLWGMAGDHGLSPVYYTLNPEKAIFEPLSESLDYPLVIKKISSDEGEGPKITNALNYPSNQGVDVVVASTAGGNFMMDMFNSQSGWQTQPVYSELTNWTPVNAPQGEKLDIIAESVEKLSDSLDYLVVRESTCDETECQVRLVAQRDGKRIDELIIKQGERYFYKANSKTALLEVNKLNPYLPSPNQAQLEAFAQLVNQCVNRADIDNPQSWCDEMQWRELTQFTPRPDSVVQLAKLYAEPRAGTVNLFPREGIGYNTKVPGRHAGESYLEKDAFIGFWGAPIGKQATPLSSEENGSLAPTLYQYLTGDDVKAGENGWGYPSLLSKLDIH
ncbi:alkaline phosphatase family protein [Vibrio coralliilyticus]|uniref:Alkaline phosphatase family protein n=1 Tax=Vibrio coralliilyticus TaxID=190893 RepID=A0AAP6ZHM7_9VIBR|nr:alkaline phosphatase family protein [Vibrio coralliilyticus]NOJ21319.1 alkaline phosphatase family protein [Vibrio coralliilyticus]